MDSEERLCENTFNMSNENFYLSDPLRAYYTLWCIGFKKFSCLSEAETIEEIADGLEMIRTSTTVDDYLKKPPSGGIGSLEPLSDISRLTEKGRKTLFRWGSHASKRDGGEESGGEDVVELWNEAVSQVKQRELSSIHSTNLTDQSTSTPTIATPSSCRRGRKRKSLEQVSSTPKQTRIRIATPKEIDAAIMEAGDSFEKKVEISMRGVCDYVKRKLADTDIGEGERRDFVRKRVRDLMNDGSL